MECPKCDSVNSLLPVWIFAEIKFIRALKCYKCATVVDYQIIYNKLHLEQIHKETEEHLTHLHGLKYR